MALDDFWFNRPDVERFIEAIEKLGYKWEITDLKERPTLRIWKPHPKSRMEKIRYNE